MTEVDPKTKPLLDLIAALGEPPLSQQKVEDFRARRNQRRDFLNTPSPELAFVQDTEVPGAAGPLKARIYDVTTMGERPTLVYFHGGGFVYGDLESHDALCRRLSHYGQLRVIAVDYRLAPEFPFPAAAEDAIAAFQGVAAKAAAYGADVTRLAVAGDSAGACLATVVARDAARRKAPAPAFQALFYPVTQQVRETPSRTRFASGYFLTAEAIEWFATHYLGAWRGGPDERISPLDFDTPPDLAPALIMIAGLDPLCDEGHDYALKLRRADVPVEVIDYPDQIHGFLSFTAFSSAAEAAIERAAKAVALALGAELVFP